MANRRDLLNVVAMVALTLIVLGLMVSLVIVSWSDAVNTATQIGQIITTGVAAVGAIVAFLVRRDVKAIHVEINSRMSQLLAMTEARAAAEALVIERAAVAAATKAAAQLAEQRARPPEE